MSMFVVGRVGELHLKDEDRTEFDAGVVEEVQEGTVFWNCVVKKTMLIVIINHQHYEVIVRIQP